MKDPLGQLRLRFAGLRLVRDHPHGQVYAGKDFSGNDVTVAVLTEPAAADPNLRRSFAEAVRAHQRGSGSGGSAVDTSDVHAAVPWAAVRAAGGDELAERLIAAVGGDPATASSSLSPAFPDALPPLPDALSHVDKPAPVFADPTFAAPPPPVPPAIPMPPAMPVPPATSPVQPAAAGPTRVPPGQRPMPPGQRPMPPGQRYQVPAAVPPRPAVRRQSSGTPVAAVVATVVIGVLLLMICCAGMASSL